MKNPILANTLVATAAIGLLFAAADASAFTSGRFMRANGEGGYSAVKFRANQGLNGGGYDHGRSVSGDGQGDVTSTRGTAFRGPDGGTGTRYGRNTRNADGSASHESGFQGSNARGSIQSDGSASRSADGTVEQSRTTTATSAATGNTRTVDESYNKTDGYSRSASCTDASGNSIPCSSR